MTLKLKQSPQIWKLANDLGLKPKDDALGEILKLCKKRVRSFRAGFTCDSLSDLLDVTAAKLDTFFIEIRSDDELENVEREYLKQGEVAFANLKSQLSPDVFAITFRRLKGAKDDRQFVSVIDCRREKAWRSYFSKWHELAHLLTLTPQMRLKFCRTHALADQKDPEEATMDVIAGTVGFLSDIINQHADGDISFEKIKGLRDKLCPEASLQASLIGFTKNWPTPSLLVQAGLGLKQREKFANAQGSFGFRDQPEPVLRALNITSNEAARQVGLQIHRNMRVPKKSVIFRVFHGMGQCLSATEDLQWWESSDGSSLPDCGIAVEAKQLGAETYALITLAKR